MEHVTTEAQVLLWNAIHEKMEEYCVNVGPVVGKELSAEMRVHQLNKACGVRVPRFDPTLQSNFKYIQTLIQVKKAQKIHLFCAMAPGGVSLSNPFKIVDVVKIVKPAQSSYNLGRIR